MAFHFFRNKQQMLNNDQENNTEHAQVRLDLEVQQENQSNKCGTKNTSPYVGQRNIQSYPQNPPRGTERSITQINWQSEKINKPIPLAVLVKRKRKIIFDSSSLNHEGFKKLVEGNFADIRAGEHSFFIPEFELARVSDNADAIVQMLLNHSGVSVMRYSQVKDYNALLVKIAVMSQEEGQLCFVVNESEKRRAILAAAKNANVYVQLFYIDVNGELHSGGRVNMEKNMQNSQVPNEIGKRRSVQKNAFMLCTTPERMQVIPIRTSERIAVGSILYDSNKQAVRLEKQEIVNPNAVTYSTNISGIWAKIYNTNALNSFVEAKAYRMLSKKVNYKGLCWPTDVLKDQFGNFVGILIPPAKGEPLHMAVFKQAKLQAYFPDWSKKDLCDLTLAILRTIEYLHSMNILMGCINPSAIRIVSKNEIYFVDTDNYQIEGFPTLVYNVSFTPPEHQGKRIYLCSKESENYAIAVLVFMLMMPGKTPYTMDQGINAVEAVIAKKFPFPNGKIRGNGTHALPGMWRFMWSHLTPKFKDSFYHTFQKDGKYELATNRLPVSEWIKLVYGFRKELDNPLDTESLKIYPRTFKHSKDDVFYTCEKCRVDHPAFYFDRRYFQNRKICNSCINKQSEMFFDCQVCGKRYFYTNETTLYHEMMRQKDPNWSKQKYCRDCKSKTLPCSDCHKMTPYYLLKNGRCRECNDTYRNHVYRTAWCRDCGGKFEITVGEHESNYVKGYNDPIRCKPCRDRRKNNR